VDGGVTVADDDEKNPEKILAWLKVLGRSHGGDVEHTLGFLEDAYRLREAGSMDEALTSLLDGVADAKKRWGEESPLTGICLMHLADFYFRIGETEKYEQKRREAKVAFGDDPDEVLGVN